VAGAAYLFRPGGHVATGRTVEATLVLRIGLGHDPEALLGDVFRRHLKEWRITVTGTARQGAALDLTYGVRLLREDGVIPLIRDLNQVEGIQSVELRTS
jgi:hypothetical protein